MRPDFPQLIDSTMRSAFRSCEQKFFREFIQKIAPKGESEHLVFGAAFAKGLEVSRKFVYRDGVSVEDALCEAMTAATIEYGKFEPPVESNKTYYRLIEALCEYWRAYPPETDPMRPYENRPGEPIIEFSFALPIPGTKHPQTGDPILYAGRFDMIAEYQRSPWVLDDKSTKQLGKSWLNQWELRSQFTGYCWAAREHGIPVVGAIIRGLSILKYDFGHAQAIVYRPEWQIDRWLYQLQRDVQRMIRCWEEGYWDYDLDNACTAYGGCPFLQLCTKKDPEPFIQTHYEHRDWNPLHLNPEERDIPSGRQRNELTFSS